MPVFAPFAPLSTARLDLVALSLEDAPAIFAYASDPEISRLVAWPRHETIETSRRSVARSLIGYAQGGHYEWALKRRSDRVFIGTCGFGEIDFVQGVGDMNYVLARPHWGQGFATEAAAAVLQFGFARLGLRIIEANAFPENIRSSRVLFKLGMQYCETSAMSQESGALLPVRVWHIEREQWAAD